MPLDLNSPSLVRRRRNARWLDRLASCGISLGGWVIVVAVVGILALILSVAWPLFVPPEAMPPVKGSVLGKKPPVSSASLTLGQAVDRVPQAPPNPTAMALKPEGAELALGWADGTVRRYDLDATPPQELSGARVDAGVSALAYVLGGETLVVGEGSGSLSVWFEVNEGSRRVFKRIRDLHSLESAVVSLTPSPRTRAVLAQDSAGLLSLQHATTGNTLVSIKAPAGAIPRFTRRGDGFWVGEDYHELKIPHPEVSLGTLFGRVWYEGFEEPSFTWQSSSGTDASEPKLSLVPLVFGSLKGTFYAMLFAVPLALLAAVYISQFATDVVKKVVKPAVEIMSAIPSVVLGFIAALWLAPRLEHHLVAVFLSFALIPLFTLLGITLWSFMRRHKQLRQMERGWEWLWTLPYVLAGAAVAYGISPWIEGCLPGGDAKEAMNSAWGLLYDPRNCMVVAFGLGFTVTPLIFTLAEDALSNVPHNLRAASLALGATRWQTVWRVMLPSASPGIFAGMIIGFGRAVGETMIVLMAAGNTPILDASPFNGMRTLAANIAVEMPEAPQGGTLYRVLFLSAVILFIFTFSFNTLAEVVRQKLRKTYGRF